MQNKSFQSVTVFALLGLLHGCGGTIAGPAATRARAERADDSPTTVAHPITLEISLDFRAPAPDLDASAVHLTATHNGWPITMVFPLNKAGLYSCAGPLAFCQRVLQDLNEGEERTMYWTFDEIEVRPGDSLELEGKLVTPDGEWPLRSKTHRPFDLSADALTDCGTVDDQFNYYEHSGPASIGRVGVWLDCRCEPNRAGIAAWAIKSYELESRGIKLEFNGDGVGRGEWQACLADNAASGKLEDRCFGYMRNVHYDEETLQGHTYNYEVFWTEEDRTYEVVFAAFEIDGPFYDIRAKSDPMVFNPATLAASPDQRPDFFVTDPRREQGFAVEVKDEQSGLLLATAQLWWRPVCR